MKFDAVLMIGFGGPERSEDIRPFLEHVTRGRRIPPARLEEVAHHYERIGGKSPLNELTFRQARALEARLQARGYALPVHVGMRNWHPFLTDTVRRMGEAGVTRAVGLIMAPQQSESSWEQYQRNVADAVAQAGVALTVEYTPPIFDHPGFIEAAARRVGQCLDQVPEVHRPGTPILFTAHSIPTSDPFTARYVEHLNASASLVARRLDHSAWQLVYQSRSGRPQDPWLAPDVNDALRQLARDGVTHAVIAPIGFLCDHVEVLYDLDVEAAQTARDLGLNLFRAKTVHDDEGFIEALTDLVMGVIHDG